MNASFALLLSCVVSLGAVAQDAPERSDLGLVQRQLKAIELLADRASSGSVDSAGARFRFDYSRFAADLKLMRQGIQQYLSPSRAQPADLVELTGNYRAEAPHSSPNDEHD
ncbi:RAQPRD family integrative conjugative element protein [Pseudomonas sp. BO3-4]|nr:MULTISPECIES: RAQPRD family integrative conjugative element protein [Pseudomonas]MDD1997097.1 RAQPRD family integrative conjugative element protein [Pseudomonas putida]MDD2010217.1 RAQPRD family integrative conjugative element protein [Pseudomonas putida]MDS9591772.1 RAQPRD family integrative conjugative element protein [Pseudomonas sp. HTZ1]UZM95720.1 RAQPRD family integrative conjugative element protein [Pseudomonas putida DOT-T1E]WPO32630.1 RAQPRD family integrative conjugative element p